jgi:hypothetical protein
MEQKKLFKVRIVERHDNRLKEIIATQEHIDFMNKYSYYSYKLIEVLGEHIYSLPSFEIVQTGGESRRSYSSQYYTLTCDRELTDDDMRVLRALGTFMHGQVHGELTEVKRDGDKFIHSIYSICDSGD